MAAKKKAVSRADDGVAVDSTSAVVEKQPKKVADESPKRVITSHVVAGDSVNHQLEIHVLDEPGPGNANHDYMILHEKDGEVKVRRHITFQNGPIKEVGVNGVTNESLLAILIDRMQGFQSGPYACHENQTVLEHLQIAMKYLQARTKARLARGVEGTMEK